MVDGFSLQISFLIFEGIFCFLSALVYGLSRDPLRQRKHVVISLNVTCGAMLICECLFYVYSGSSSPADILISRIVNAGVYYLIVILLLLYLMLVSVRLFARFDIKPDMPCRKRVLTICALVIIGLILISLVIILALCAPLIYDYKQWYEKALDCSDAIRFSALTEISI